MKWDGANPMKFIGLDNFTRLISDTTFHKALWNTIVYTIGVVPLTMIVALALAILLNQKNYRPQFHENGLLLPLRGFAGSGCGGMELHLQPDHGAD
ncbi:carbohydrate ABC transporter permease [Paenibacillus rhizoplanae]